MRVSKTDYLVYRDCAHNAWVKVYLPEVYKARPLVREPHVISLATHAASLRSVRDAWQMVGSL